MNIQQLFKFSSKQKRFLKFFWGGYLALFLMTIGLFWLVSMDVLGKLPDFDEVENPNTNLASLVYSSDGKILGTYYRENRTLVEYEDLSPHLIYGLIATEDQRFYDHSGIDFRSLSRAIIKMGKSGGASTITQQLAKMLFTERPSRDVFTRIQQKMKEWVIALRLERHYTKDEILTMYFNRFDFLYQAVGIKSASFIYFGKYPNELNVQEAAMLVAMAKNPSLYNPKRFPDRALERRNLVLGLMSEYGVLGELEADSIKELPIDLSFTSVSDHNEGVAPYFREHLRQELLEWSKNHKKADGSPYDIYEDGLQIHTTIDSRMQKYAEQAVATHLKNLQRIFYIEQKRNPTAPFVDISDEAIEKIYLTSIYRSDRYKSMMGRNIERPKIFQYFQNNENKMKVFSWKGEIDTVMTPMDSIRYYKHILESGMMAMDPTTGQVKVWVGGINHKYFKFDHVHHGKRQVGSTFKPFVYTAAIDQLNLSPCHRLPNTNVTFSAQDWGIPLDWTPKNANDKYGGMMSLSQALATSTNVITARLVKEIGAMNPIQSIVKQMGVSTYIPPVPAICLGVTDISVYEMVSAYSTFANRGVYTSPIIIDRIESKDGQVITSFVPQTRDVLTEEKAYVMLKLMERVTEYGTGVRLKISGNQYPRNCVTGFPYKFTNPIAGKTGTTQNHSDGWFIGMVPNLATGVWVGGQERSVHFKSVTYGQGATMALPIWALFMKACYEDPTLNVSKGHFRKPSRLSISLDCSRNSEFSSNFGGEGGEDEVEF